MTAIKLYLDEDITAGPHLAATLRRRGFDVVNTIDVGNRKLDDQAQFAYAIAQQRVLLTFNIHDYIPLAQEFYAAGQEFPGLIVSPQLQGHRFETLLKLILNLLNQVDVASMRNTIRFLQEFQ
jgi:hypothetical protein